MPMQEEHADFELSYDWRRGRFTLVGRFGVEDGLAAFTTCRG